MGKGKKKASLNRPQDKFSRFLKAAPPKLRDENALRTPSQAAQSTPQLKLSTNPGEPSNFSQRNFHIKDTVVHSQNRSRLFGTKQASERILSDYEQEQPSSSFESTPESQKSPIPKPPAALIHGSTQINQPALPYH